MTGKMKIAEALLIVIPSFVAFNAFAQNSTTVGAVTIESTFECLSVVVEYSGDDNADNAVSFLYRESGGGSFVQAHDMVRLTRRRWAGSIVGLDPGTQVDVRVEFSDPDGIDGEAAAGSSAWTRAEGVPAGTGAAYHVSALAGSDETGSGGEESPWATIQKAADEVTEGDTVIVHEGVYREEVVVRSSGEPDNPVTFKAAEGESVVIDGSHESLAGPGGDEWTSHSGSVWYAQLDVPAGFVAEDGRRLYHYEDALADLESLAEGYPGGWFYDESSGRLYVRTREEDNPDDHAVQVGRVDNGFYIDGRHDIVIEGFEIRFQGSGPYGKSIYIRHSSRVWVRNCILHSSNGSVLIRFEDSEDNVIEWNDIYDTEVTSWDWDDVKAHDAENSGVSVRGGSGNVVRFNSVHGIFNGIALSTWGDLENEAFNHNVDVYGNRLYDISDDGIEPEGACINMRIWGNFMDDHHNCISLAPITIGPLYAWRNVMSNFYAGSFKVSVDSEGPCFLYHNTAYSDEPEQNAFSPSGGYGNMTFRNNIFRSTRYVIEDMGENISGVTWDYDNLFTTDSGRFVKWDDVRYADLAEFSGATGFETHGMSAVSLFVDVAGLDFNLQETSPEVDSAAAIPNFSDGYCGSAPDIGAYEFVTEGCNPANPDSLPEVIEEAAEREDAPDVPPDSSVDGAPDGTVDTTVDGEPMDGGNDGCGCRIVL